MNWVEIIYLGLAIFYVSWLCNYFYKSFKQ